MAPVSLELGGPSDHPSISITRQLQLPQQGGLSLRQVGRGALISLRGLCGGPPEGAVSLLRGTPSHAADQTSWGSACRRAGTGRCAHSRSKAGHPRQACTGQCPAEGVWPVGHAWQDLSCQGSNAGEVNAFLTSPK